MGKILDEMLKEQEKNKIKFEKKTSTYDVKNYLNLKLSNNEDEKTVKVRLLSIGSDSDSPTKELYGHWFGKNYTCTKHTKDLPEGVDKRCPFCETEEIAKAEQKLCPHTPKWDKLKDIVKKNTKQQANVVRVIERGDEDFGPKFWKMGKSHYETITDLVVKVFKEEGIDVYDYKEGLDVEISLKKEDNGSTKIKSITLARRQTPLSTSQETIDKWVNDEKKWSDVFAIKSYEYLEIIINGGEPWFSKDKNKWVDKKEFEKQKEETIDTKEETDDDDEVEGESFYEGTEEATSDTKEDLPF